MMDARGRGHIVADYAASNADPIAFAQGEAVVVSDRVDAWAGNPAWLWVWCTDARSKSGWVPAAYIQRRGEASVALREYRADELTVRAGEEVAVGADESGWLWCSNQHGHSGWVPRDHVELGDDAG